MKALRTKICTYAIALLASIGFATSTLAGSSDFSGIFIAGHAELNVVAIDGSSTTPGSGATVSGKGGSDNTETTQGTIGGFAPTAGYEIGFNMPLGDTFFITVGYADGGGRSAAIAKVDDGSGDKEAAGSTTDVSLHASNPSWWYIAPSISIFDNSAVYFKLGQAKASLKAIGDVTGAPGNLKGDMWGIGTTSIADNGLFIKTEAGAVQYDNFTLTGIGGDADRIVEGNPLVGYGHVSIGYKF
jgi:hypothetical protein